MSHFWLSELGPEEVTRDSYPLDWETSAPVI